MKTIKCEALKIMPEFFKAVVEGRKTFEVRKNDRDFKVGGFLCLMEWDGQKFTGEQVVRQIIYMTDWPQGLQPGYVVLGLR